MAKTRLLVFYFSGQWVPTINSRYTFAQRYAMSHQVSAKLGVENAVDLC